MTSLKNHVDTDPELVIGIVAPIGTKLDVVVELLSERLTLARYETETIRVSSQVIPMLKELPESWESRYDEISGKMESGNECRKQAKDNSILALGAAATIYGGRSQSDGSPIPRPKTAFIIRSLKRPEEVHELRRIYADGFILIGIHSDKNRRLSHLRDDLGIPESNALKLIARDEDEAHAAFGQRVNKTFHLADFFVHITDNNDRLRNDIHRIVDSLFGQPYLTPTFDEYAMFFAFAAALRSADLSRQVGAVIARDDQILSTGANDCPRAGGGLYWPASRDSESPFADAERGRDYKRGEDSNRVAQLKLMEDIIANGKIHGLSAKKLRLALEESGIEDITEYGRVVHAEMEAMLSCARTHQSTLEATLYSTTFPCHNCAKHIVASGIRRVVFIEPYPKSKALEFHDDSIHLQNEKNNPAPGKVLFEPFVGIGPRRFFDLFSMQLGSGYHIQRKNRETGSRIDWRIEDARLRLQMKPSSYLDLELEASDRFSEQMTLSSDWSKDG